MKKLVKTSDEIRMSSEFVWANALGVNDSQLNEWIAASAGAPSLLIWCLENQKIDEDNYLAWAQKTYQISQLNNDFFKTQSVPFDLFDKYFKQIPNSAIPVTVWDGVLFIASPEPLPEITLDIPHQWVIASWIQIVNWRNQYEKELNAKEKGSTALGSLDFGSLGGTFGKTASPTPEKAETKAPQAAAPAPAEKTAAPVSLDSLKFEIPGLSNKPEAPSAPKTAAPLADAVPTKAAPTIPAIPVAAVPPTPAAPQVQTVAPTPAAPQAQTVAPTTPAVAAKPAVPAPPPVGAKAASPIAVPKVTPPPRTAAPAAVTVAPRPAVVAPPPTPAPQVAASEEKTVIEAAPRPAAPAAAATPRPSSGTNTAIRKVSPVAPLSSVTSSPTQTRSSVPPRTGTAAPRPAVPQASGTVSPRPLGTGVPKPAATNRAMPNAGTSAPQADNKVPRPKVPLGAEGDEFTKTGFSKTAMSQTKVTRVKLGAENEQGATAVRMQRPSTNGVVIMDPRFKIDHPKFLKSLDDLPFYLLHRLRDLYDKTMILTFAGGILKPWRWDDSWGHPNEQTQAISVNAPSMFRIPLQTRTPYHGHIVKNPVHDAFLTEWSPKALPEHVTILPMIVDGNVAGLILGVVKQNKVSRIRLEDVESIAQEAGQLMLALPNRPATTAA